MSDFSITLARFTEAHITDVTALYNDPAVTRQVLQMPFQSSEVWRKRLGTDDERQLKLVALHQGEVIGHLGIYAVRDGRWMDTLAMARLR